MAPPIRPPLPITSRGDLIVGGVAGVPERLAVGATDEYLYVTSDGDLAWRGAAMYDARTWVEDWGATPATFMTYYQNALNEVAGNGGGTLVFPEAAWKFRHDIGYRADVSSNTRLLMLGGYFDVTGGDFGNTELVAAGESGSNYLGVGFRVRATSDGTAKTNIVFDGLDFRGDYTGIWRGNTYYQSTLIDGWLVGTTLNRDIHVRNCKFRNIYGFPVHIQAQNDTGSGISSGYLFSFTNNVIDTCGNGVNTNWPNSLHAHNQFYNSEGFECAGINTTIIHNQFRDAYGAISLGGDTTANRELPGGIIAFNQIDTDFVDQSITLQDGAVGALVAFNVIRKARRIGIYAGLASTGVVPRDVQIIGNQLISCGQIINAWAGTTAYVVGDWVHKTVGTSGDAFVCTVAGTSGGAEPTWPTVDGDTIASGTATFMLKGNFNTSSRYALYVPSDKCYVMGNRQYVEADDTTGWQPTHGMYITGDDCWVVNNESAGSSLYDLDIDGTFTTTKGQRTRVSGNRTTIVMNVERGAVVENAADIGRVFKAYSAGNHTLRRDEEMVTMDTGASGRTFTLPTAVGIPGKQYEIRNLGTSNTLTVDGSGTETVCGALTRVLQPGEKVTIRSDNANWLCVGPDIRIGSETKDWGNIVVGASLTEAVTVTGAALGDFAEASMSIDITGLVLSAYVSAADTVTCVLSNTTAGAVDLGSGTLYATVRKR